MRFHYSVVVKGNKSDFPVGFWGEQPIQRAIGREFREKMISKLSAEFSEATEDREAPRHS